MVDKIKNKLDKQHLFIIGGNEVDRQKFISTIIEIANLETFRFPANMTLFSEYYDFIKKENLYNPFYEAKTYNGNAIIDFHREWISENTSLIIMEEFDSMEERWKIELLRLYINEIENRKKGEKKIRLIISQEAENGLIQKLSKVMNVRENEKRTEKQIVEQNLKIIDISQ